MPQMDSLDPKGKKRAHDQVEEVSSTRINSVVVSDVSPTPKKQKRAETRPCPICSESIPVRLLEVHASLESRRLDDILSNVGSTDALLDEAETESNFRSSSRRSAQKARKSTSILTGLSALISESVEEASKSVQSVRRRRKQRGNTLRELADQTDDYNLENTTHEVARRRSINEIQCPVCLITVRGEEDILDAHIDSCLANESRRMSDEREQEEKRLRDQDEELSAEDNGHLENAQALGFHSRNSLEADVEEDVDIDGEVDEFGEAQFNEGDILGSSELNGEVDPETDGEQPDEVTLRDLVIQGKVMRRTDDVFEAKEKMDEIMGVGEADRVEKDIISAKNLGNPTALIAALEGKIKLLESTRISSSTSLLCRICLDPYVEATVSTGCWHTLCRECWLRCLGSTKLCPSCKRITLPTDLRRVFL